jgi:hypothetical protein
MAAIGVSPRIGIYLAKHCQGARRAGVDDITPGHGRRQEVYPCHGNMVLVQRRLRS